MITTKRLILQPYRLADEAAMVEMLMNDTITQTFLVPDFTTSKQVSAVFYKLYEKAQQPHQFEQGIYWKETMIGFITAVAIQDTRIELGYVIHPSYTCQGFAREALAGAIAYLFAHGFETIEASAFSENIASRRVMEACGMKRIDKEDTITYRGMTHTCVTYRLYKKA